VATRIAPFAVTFGFSQGERGSFQGLAQFSDARLLLFPVHSLAGPVWVTCHDVLRDLSITETEPGEGKVRIATDVQTKGKINLGWLMFEIESNGFSLDGKLKTVPKEILNRAVLISNKMFGHIVNDNLEVRTSVSIDPATGAQRKAPFLPTRPSPGEVCFSSRQSLAIQNYILWMAVSLLNAMAGSTTSNQRSKTG